MDAERLVAILREEPDRSFSLTELMGRAKMPAKKEKEAKRVLKGLVRDGTLEREPGRRYRLSRAGQRLDGRVTIDRRGFPMFLADGEPKRAIGVPFLFEGRPALDELEDEDEDEDEEQEPEVPERTIVKPSAHSISVDELAHDDRVRVEMVSRGRQSRTYARLLELLKRPEKRHIGIFRNFQGALFVELDEALNPFAGQTRRVREIIIPPSGAGHAEAGQLVEVAFEHNDPSGRSSPVGRVLEVLGTPGERDTELQKLLIEHGLDRPFPAEVLRQAEELADEPTADDLLGRKDVRYLPLMTIDGETAKDFDDAVCALRDGRDRYKLFVAIADVSHYVRMGTSLDEEAYHRGTSTYLTDRAIPMLPEKLSNGLCSLNPDVDRLCMLAEMSVASSGRVLDAQFSRAVMRSKARLTYTQVAHALEGEPDAATEAVLPTLLLLSSIASKLLERRLRRGSLDLDLPEPVVEFDASGDPLTATRRPRNAAHRLIEDLMIATNEAAARWFLERDLGTLFRIHAPPDPEKMQAFGKLCLELGIDARVSERPSPAEVSHLLAKLSEHPQGQSLHGLLLRALSAARYHADNEGHFGLGSEAYLHFTSPIRRYPDLVVHRLLKRAIDGARPWYSHAHLQKMGDECSAAERRAMAAERASMELDRALIAQKHLGERLPAVITGVQTFGLFCATLEPFLEGLVPVQTLPDDFYEADEHGTRLIGTKRGHRFALGDSLEVEINSVNLSRRQVELRLVDERVDAPSDQTGTEETSSGGPRPGRLDPREIAAKRGFPRKSPRPSVGRSRKPAKSRSRAQRRGPR